MGIPLSTYASGRDNNFNLIRFIAAFLVLFSHSFALALGHGDGEPLRAMVGMTFGDAAVDVFFITSGFLITSSYFARNNLRAFVRARVLRIYPALIVAVIFCVFIVGATLTTRGVADYFLDPQTREFFVKNITLFFGVEYKLPGVFSDTPYKNAVNGSLWTLPYEVKMYAILTILLVAVAHVGKRVTWVTFRNVILVVSVLAIGLHLFRHFNDARPGNFVRLFSMFFVGAAFHAWRDKVRLSTGWAAAGMALLLVLLFQKDAFFVVYCLALPFLVFYAAYVPSGRIRAFNRLGDYSYGLYIYAFPVQQSVAHLVPGIGVPAMLALSFSVTLFLAVLSWHLIEENALRLKERHVSPT